ncbi:MAG: hypothetical protein WDO24_21905 [Pseudomonadota bacterium]
MAQTTSSATRPRPAMVSKPQSGTGHDAVRITDHGGDPFEPFGDDLGMLDEIGRGIDHAGDDGAIVADQIAHVAVFVRMTGIGERQHETADRGLAQNRDDVGERHVAVVRSLRNCPSRHAGGSARAECPRAHD